MDMNFFYDKYLAALSNALNSIDSSKVKILYDQIMKTKVKNGKLLIFGNGANMSNASHFATDMTKNGKIKTMVFSDANLITCFSNDYGFEKWVSKAIEYYADKKDIVILLSASGKSKNLINAANFCKKKKIQLITITGFDKKNKLSKLGNINIWINSKSYNLVEIAQMTILLSIVDKKIGKLVYSSKM